MSALPLPSRNPSQGLIPKAPSAFWNYLAAWGGAPAADYARAKGLLDVCAAEDPACATIALAQGELQFFHALQSANNDAESLHSAES